MGTGRVRGVSAAVAVASLAALSAACMPPDPYVRYTGNMVRRPPKPVESMSIYRAGPPNDIQTLGTVVVTCPSSAMADGLGGAQAVGGCTYTWALRAAAKRAAEMGADGIHTIESSVNSAGAVVSLTASSFMYLPVGDAERHPKAAPDEGDKNVEARLRRLDKLKADQLITPEEYDRKRAQILDDI